ncbi:MAG TPA: hypothetical protein VF701_08360 [Thermoanaerobaculia bacterium]
MTDDFEPSEQFADFFFLAIDHGFGSIEDGGGPLIPFVMSVSVDGQKHLTRFVTDELSEGVQRAQEHVVQHRDGMMMYAIAWDGYITLDDRKWDAILVEAGEAHDPRGVLFAQRYEAGPKKLFRRSKNERVGNPALVDYPPSRIASAV